MLPLKIMAQNYGPERRVFMLVSELQFWTNCSRSFQLLLVSSNPSSGQGSDTCPAQMLHGSRWPGMDYLAQNSHPEAPWGSLPPSSASHDSASLLLSKHACTMFPLICIHSSIHSTLGLLHSFTLIGMCSPLSSPKASRDLSIPHHAMPGQLWHHIL